jgi:hypothetical protein
MIIKIDDSFCEWEYEVNGLERYSIEDIINIIARTTEASVISSKCVKVHPYGI